MVFELECLHDFQKEVIESDKPVLVDFWAEWCGACQILSPLMDEIAEERSDIKVCKVNAEDMAELARDYKIMGLPTLMVFRNGEMVNRHTGSMSKERVLALIEE